jgi:hypothetical protein
MKRGMNAFGHHACGAALTTMFVVAACSGDGPPANGTGGTGAGGGGSGGTGGTRVAASFDRDIQKPIFDALCIDCHHSKSAIGYDLTKPFDPITGIIRRENSWLSHGSTQTVVVDPGNVSNSFIIKKVESATLDGAVDGSPMPTQIPPLAQAEIDAIQKWINDGAKNDAYFTNTVAPIFGTAISLAPSVSGKCTFCHYPGAPSGMNVLDVFDAAEGMVNRNSRYGGGAKIVAPGDAAASTLVKKLTGITLGPQMPLRKPRLTPAQVETLRQWIMAGAPNN